MWNIFTFWRFITLSIFMIAINAHGEKMSSKNEALIAYNLNEEMQCPFVFIFVNNSVNDILTTSFMTNDNYLSLTDIQGECFSLTSETDPAAIIKLKPGATFWKFSYVSRLNYIQKYNKSFNPDFVTMNWKLLDDELEDIGKTFSFLWNSSKSKIFKSIHDLPDEVNFKIVHILGEQYFSLALIVTNDTKEDTIFSDFFTKNNTLKIKFPDGKIYEHPIDPKAGEITLNPGESKYIKFNIEELLKESKDFSMDKFNYGLSELIWEIKQPDGKVVTKNFWLIKFNGELPEDKNGYGYKVDGPLTSETFRDKKFSILPPAKADIPFPVNSNE